MSISRQITCINKTPRYDAHDRIRTVGGSWGKESQPDVIKQIDAGTHNYYVSVGGNTVKVIVATHNGNKYIKTERDYVQPDNLLSLPECN
jgi:hypothetical protein